MIEAFHQHNSTRVVSLNLISYLILFSIQKWAVLTEPSPSPALDDEPDSAADGDQDDPPDATGLAKQNGAINTAPHVGWEPVLPEMTQNGFNAKLEQSSELNKVMTRL